MTPEPQTGPAPNALTRLFNGEALADIEGVPQAQLEAQYGDACQLIERGDFEAALDPLVQLVTLNAWDFRFQFSYGLCLHQLGHAEDAARHYAMAWVLRPTDAACAFRMGECHAALGDREAAAEAFETAITLCSPPELNAAIRQAAESALVHLHS